jgi:hypothetical protein
MRVTQRTKDALAYRREKRDLEALGYEQITCTHGIGKLWELDRGGRKNWRIIDAIVGVDGKSVYVHAAPQ